MSAYYNLGEDKERPGLYMRFEVRGTESPGFPAAVPVGPGVGSGTEVPPTPTSTSNVRVSEVTLLAADWVERDSYYAQAVTIDGITKYSQVDLKPTIEQLAIFYDKDLAFVTENDAGVVTVYAIGQRPANDYTMQVTITEVKV